MLYQEKTPLERPLSAIGFGGAGISGEGGGYGFGPLSENEAERLLRTSWEHGINLYDTAPIYGFGLSEERFGRYLPQDAVIVTKGGVDWHANRRVNMTNDPKVIFRMLEESLKRLKRDRIDVYMIHWPDPKVDIRRPIEILKLAQELGLIHKIGLCNSHSEDLKRAREIVEVDFFQSELNLFNHRTFDFLGEAEFTMSWGTLDKGILSGRVHSERKFSKEDCRSWAPWWNKKEVTLKTERVKKLLPILQEREIGLLEFCLSFNRLVCNVSTCLVGFKTENDLVEVTSSLQRNLNKATIMEVLDLWNKE